MQRIKGRGMTSLRLFDTERVAAARNPTSRLFDTSPRSERSQLRGWPYGASMILHAIVLTSVVILARHLIEPPPPTPSLQNREVAHTFVFTGSRNDHSRPRGPRRAQRARNVPVTVVADTAPAPLPPARDESRVPETTPIAEQPHQTAFDPPIPAGPAKMTGHYGDPRETNFGAATASVRGSPTSEVRSGGFGEGNVVAVRTGSLTPGRAGLDGTGEGDGAFPPRIQEPLPIPEYPPEARTRRLQGVVVLEVTLDALGKAHVRRVLSDPLGFGIEEAATNAAERLRFTPARQGGRSVDAVVQVRVTFTLTGNVATVVTGGA
jgi:protein TonB